MVDDTTTDDEPTLNHAGADGDTTTELGANLGELVSAGRDRREDRDSPDPDVADQIAEIRDE